MRKLLNLLLILLLSLLFIPGMMAQQNTITPEETAKGWVLLFEGRNVAGYKCSF